jgi:hypothetical protein
MRASWDSFKNMVREKKIQEKIKNYLEIIPRIIRRWP